MNLKFLLNAPSFPEAVCATLDDKDFFFPTERGIEADRLPQLKQLCGSCIHRKECLEYALKEQIPYGVWGGKSPKERVWALIPAVDQIATKGLAGQIKKHREKGLSAKEIAYTLNTSITYVNRIFKKIDEATDKGASQSHQQTKSSFADSEYLSGQA